MARMERADGAKILLKKKHHKALVKDFPELNDIKDRYRWNNDDETENAITVNIRWFSIEALQALFELYQKDGSQMGDRHQMGLIRGQIEVMKNPTGAKIGQLRPLETAMMAFIKKNIIRGWVFMKDGDRMQAYQVHNVAYHPPVQTRDGSIPPYVKLELNVWGQGKNKTKKIEWHAGDLKGHTVSELLAEKNVFHETQEFLDAYDKDEKRFIDWRKKFGEQFVGNGEMHYEHDKDSWSWRDRKENINNARMVVDDRCDSIDDTKTTCMFYYLDEDTGEAEGKQSMEEAEKYSQQPCEHYVWCYNLISHNSGYVHIDQLQPYVYRPELRDKLILPPEHGDLIDALTADMDVLMEDIISGKTGGTTIICQGKAGTGKTLTAEVYSEIVKRPLYRIHSGQLGTNAESVENELNAALKKAQSWKAVMLIDEADVFVSQRDGNLEKNAVVSVFLRTLEYYDGLLFLTTNRLDTIDEAILSRCIAQIQYKEPSVDERFKLWQTLGSVYGMDLVKDKKMAKELADTFVCTGRDIKGLIKLVTKYARQRNKKIEVKDFVRMATFKGIKVVQ